MRSQPDVVRVYIDATRQAQWQLVIPAPCAWLSANDRRNRWSHAELAGTWRNTAFMHARRAGLPKGLARVRIDAVLRFRNRRRRDPANYHATLKPIVDGLCPERRYTDQHGRPVTLPGHGLIPDDNPTHLDGPHIAIGDPLQPVKYGSVGEVHLTITQLTQLTEVD
jgi:hypothetical protein